MSEQIDLFSPTKPVVKPTKPALKPSKQGETQPTPADPPPPPYNGPIRRYTIHKEPNLTTIWNEHAPSATTA